jgi:hypothetical protein
MGEEKKPKPKKRIVEVDLRDLIPTDDAKGGATLPNEKKPEASPPPASDQ